MKYLPRRSGVNHQEPRLANVVKVIEKLIRGRTVSTGCRRVELHTQDAGWPGKSFPALNLIGNYQLQMAA